MCDALRDAAWYVNRVNNGAAAIRSDVYANRGAEIWFEAKRLIEEKKMILPDDPVFIRQKAIGALNTPALRSCALSQKNRWGIAALVLPTARTPYSAPS